MNNNGMTAAQAGSAMATLMLRSEVQADSCRMWQGSLTEKGYGRVKVAGRVWRAHRLMWTLLFGEIPEGLTIDHMCWNRACVEPKHLRLATVTEQNSNRLGKRTPEEIVKHRCALVGVTV